MKSKGKILRVKQGYNPNSSSVGSQVPFFLGFITTSGVISIFILHLMRKVKKIIRKKDEKET